MSDPQDARGVADREAAEWHVRLGERPVSASTLAEFRRWRTEPANTDAYHRLETLWRTTGTLSGDAEIQAVTREALRSSGTRLTSSRRTALWSGAAALTTALVAAVVLSVWSPTRGVYETEVGEQRLIRLKDGSEVRLDTATRLRVRYGKTERRVVLEQGQALFMVAHNASRPFRVEAGATEVTALGTTFDVRREPGGARVTLVTGSVGVVDTARRDRRWRLAPSQRLETSAARPAPEAVDAAEATSWSQGRLVFHDTPLREAVAEVNRYLPDKITLAAGAAETVRINAVFKAGDGDAFVAAASDLFGLQAERDATGGVRLSAPSVGG